MKNSTPTRQQVEEAEALLAQHKTGKRKLSRTVLEELDRIETSFVWHSMDYPHDREAAFAAMEQDRLSNEHF